MDLYLDVQVGVRWVSHWISGLVSRWIIICMSNWVSAWVLGCLGGCNVGVKMQMDLWVDF